MDNRLILISDQGCDRATAYHMSSKILRRNHELYLTWLDQDYRSILTRVNPQSGTVGDSIALAQGTDNHCGAAMVKTSDERFHFIAGAHASGFIYRGSDDPGNPASWSLPQGVGVGATYPSLVAMADDSLVLTYRHSALASPWLLLQQIRSPEGEWSWHQALVQAPAPGYSFFTNTLTRQGDTLHLLAEFYKTWPNNLSPSRSMAVTHLYSTDNDLNWFYDDDRPMTCAPAGIEDCSFIMHAPKGDLRPGNLAVAANGTLFCGIWDANAGEAFLCRQERPGNWSVHALNSYLQDLCGSGYATSQVRLAADQDGSILAVTTCAREKGWCQPDNQIVILRLDGESMELRAATQIPQPRAGESNWLPSLEMGRLGTEEEPLYMIFTDGNRGETCVNDARCQVWLLPLRA